MTETALGATRDGTAHAHAPPSGIVGLTEREAASRLTRDGFNELPSARPRSLAAIAWGVMREPMFLMLIAASAIYVVLGDHREAVVLSASVIVVVGITFHQQRKSERALDALRELSSPRALVLRDGDWKRIAGRDAVVGDIFQVREGDRVPTDAVLLEGENVSVDESLLTGESVPVRKRATVPDTNHARPGGDDLPFVFSGTLVTQGIGIARASATGPRTEIGRIGKALQAVRREPSGIETETRRAVIVFAALSLALCTLVTVAYAVMRDDWLHGLLAGITLAMANLPEEFPVVLTVFLALGAWRISRKRVLTRQPAAIETLGATTVLCVDKTGTLTENRMAVARLWMLDGADASPHRVSGLPPLIHYGVLASEPLPFDPMDQAFHRLAQDRMPSFADARNRLHSYPLTPEQLSVAHIWDGGGEGCHDVAAKGAHEAIAALCALGDAPRTLVEAEVARMAHEGLRVLAIAGGTLPRGQPWPSSQRELRLRFIGLAGLADPIRPAVPAALAECYAAGIRTVMITGDYPGTAAAIAQQIGLAPCDPVVTGVQLDTMTDDELRDVVRRANVFARVVPEQKLKLVQALKANGEIVAMTGDGVNDAPALKSAHIGVAMGKRGSDVAREASSLVLLDDDFSSLVEAVRLGRRIYTNIASAMRYIIAVHVPTAGMALLPIAFGWPLVLHPVHVVFLEFVIDPACSVVFEAEPAKHDAMRRPPRPVGTRLFSPSMIGTSLAQGMIVLASVFLLYGWAITRGTPEQSARAMAFAAIVFGNIGLIFVSRSRTTILGELADTANPTLWWLVGGALGGLLLSLYVAPLREVFRFAPLSPAELTLSALAGAAGLALLAASNGLRRHLAERSAVGRSGAR
jgi:P-type Ca2+ transporter type 2C